MISSGAKVVNADASRASTTIPESPNDNNLCNILLLPSTMTEREVIILRTLAHYLRQLRFPHDMSVISAALAAYPSCARDLVELFVVRHNPDLPEFGRNIRIEQIQAAITTLVDSIAIAEHALVIRRLLNLIQASVRTNFFQTTVDGNPKPCLAIKFNSSQITDMPRPCPWAEIFIYSPRFEAVHLRGGKVARGGIRWSDRHDDFRDEILGLVKAQMVKNAIIVPTGSKGGFVLCNRPSDPEALQAEGQACYRLMMCALLDLTDNRVGSEIITPARTVCYDGEDPYLVVAADKGTANFSDIANEVSHEYGYWLDDAFASGGSAGYNHKQMAITARGAWEAVRRHFREIGRDIQTQDFTCIGVGDMSGDVFGNGMLQSRNTCLTGAFDHRHIFCDPNPDAALSYTERARLFNLKGSSWNDYDRSKISHGGGVFSRRDKVIHLSPEMQKAYGIAAATLTPHELITAMLKAPADLLYFGGIGTYIKADSEDNASVGDRANEEVRINGGQVRAAVVVEGANLAVTQCGRIEYAVNGGRINTDAIDNSAGVDTSDHEVNIKILLQRAVADGSMSLVARNTLLVEMTEEVAELVLRDNYLQTQALSMAVARAAIELPAHLHVMQILEQAGLLDRAVEFLPDATVGEQRLRDGRGLTRPELAVMMAYAKLWLYDTILATDIVDDPAFDNYLIQYFPRPLRQSHAADIAAHRLRQEIMATVLCNEIINTFGIASVFTLAEKTGQSYSAVVRAATKVYAALDLAHQMQEIASLDNRAASSTQTEMMLALIDEAVAETEKRLLGSN